MANDQSEVTRLEQLFRNLAELVERCPAGKR